MSKLLQINVNEHTEKKNGLTYLSWAWAWAEVLKVDPMAEWHPAYFGPETNQTPYCVLPDGSMLVGVRVMISGAVKSCLLPVMDHRNKAIKNPDAFAVNTALMRCLCKAIAMHGLGLYIYAGEDLPEGEHTDQETGEITGPDLRPALQASIEQEKQKRAGVMGAVLPAVEAYLDTATKAGLIKLSKELVKIWDAATPDDRAALCFDRIEIEELDNEEKTFLASLLQSNMRSALKTERQHRAMTNVPV